MPGKGEKIRIVKGTYAGHDGWLNTSKKTKKNSIFRHVIVALDDGNEVEKRVWFTSYRKAFLAPKSYEEAAIQQHSDIDLAMIRLAQMFAECGLSANVNVLNLFQKELEIAHKNQKGLGKKARYRHVEYDDLEDIDMNA